MRTGQFVMPWLNVFVGLGPNIKRPLTKTALLIWTVETCSCCAELPPWGWPGWSENYVDNCNRCEGCWLIRVIVIRTHVGQLKSKSPKRSHHTYLKNYTPTWCILVGIHRSRSLNVFCFRLLPKRSFSWGGVLNYHIQLLHVKFRIASFCPLAWSCSAQLPEIGFQIQASLYKWAKTSNPQIQAIGV